MGNIGVWPAGRIRDRLNPSRLIVAFSRGPVGLNIDRFHDIAAGPVAAILIDRIVPADRLIRTEDTPRLRPGRPRQVIPPPDMMMGLSGRKRLPRGVPLRVRRRVSDPLNR